jgi:uncharacterized protein YoxC
MPALLQICIVIVTIGVLTIALLTVRMMARFFSKAAEDISQLTAAVRESVDQIDLVARESRALVASLRDCVPPVQRVVDRFEHVGQRTADLSSSILDELERPVFTVSAAVVGIRLGAGHLLKRLMHRFTHRSSPINGDHDYE